MGRLQALAQTLDHLECHVRRRDVDLRQVIREDVGLSELELDPVRRRVARGRVDGRRFEVEGDDGPEAQLRRRDPDHAGPAAGVEQRATRHAEKELDAIPIFVFAREGTAVETSTTESIGQATHADLLNFVEKQQR